CSWHGDGHPETKVISNEGAVKFFRGDADDRVLNPVEILRSADDVRIAAVTILPGSIPDHGHRMRIATFTFLRSEAAPENRSPSERVEVLRRDDCARRAFSAIANAQGCAGNLINDERFKQRGILLVIEKFWVGQSSVPILTARCGVQRKHMVLVRDQRIRANQNSFDPTEHRGVGSDAECEAKQRKNGKSRTAPKHPEAEAKILEKRLHLVRHSDRNASIGSTRVARRAGKKQARSAAAASITLETRRANGSLGLTSYKIWASTRPAANESRRPTATASAVCIAPCRIINAKTSRRCAPSAMRMPISRVTQTTRQAC